MPDRQGADGRFGGAGHSQPEPIDFRDPARSRETPETLGAAIMHSRTALTLCQTD